MRLRLLRPAPVILFRPHPTHKHTHTRADADNTGNPNTRVAPCCEINTGLQPRQKALKSRISTLEAEKAAGGGGGGGGKTNPAAAGGDDAPGQYSDDFEYADNEEERDEM